MKNNHRAAAGAAALLAAGIVGLGTASTASASIAPPGTCSPTVARISADQLKDSIASAAALEKQGSVAPLNVHPMGGWPPPGSSNV